MIDFRSDTFTRPSEAMRKIMYKAEVGDDVFAEDKSVLDLQNYACELFQKEAALFVPSGTMGNLIAVAITAGKGKEFIVHNKAHIVEHELGGAAAIAGAMPIGVESDYGIFTPEDIADLLHDGLYFTSKTSLVCMENSHNSMGGTCWTPQQMQDIYDFAHKNDLHVHTDGARLLNVVEASGHKVSEYTQATDSLMVCLSKGLGAPVGSLLLGKKDFISEASNWRKMLGGGMRQAGIVASAGLWALQNNRGQLRTDNAHAQKIAQTLNELEWAELDLASVQTNMVYFSSRRESAFALEARLKDRGILAFAIDKYRVRFVASLEVNSSDIDKACNILQTLYQEG